MRTPRDARGFTLIELTVAVSILALVVTFVYQVIFNAVRLRDYVRVGLESPKVEASVLDQIVRDFRFLYYRAGLFPGDAGFVGRSATRNGREADQVHFLTCRASKTALLEDVDETPGDAPLIEVGYALRASDTNAQWLELWRREDYYADDDPTDGGKYELLYPKVRSFELRYYPVPEDNPVTSGLEEWDSKIQKKPPYAVMLTMRYDVGTAPTEEPDGHVVKVILVKGARSLPPDAGMGMEPAMGMR